MSFRIEDLPTLDNSGRLGRSGIDRSLADAYIDASQPSIATQVASLGAAVGVGAIQALQGRFGGGASAMMAGGAGPSYSTYPDCTIYGYNGTCEEPCFGFEPHHMDSFYCATCDEQAADPVNNPAWHWHYVGTRGSIEYMDREPDVCNGRDAWKWKVGACRDCNESAIFRCHDGWKRYSDGTLAPTICEGLISCDDQLTLCP